MMIPEELRLGTTFRSSSWRFRWSRSFTCVAILQRLISPSLSQTRLSAFERRSCVVQIATASA